MYKFILKCLAEYIACLKQEQERSLRPLPQFVWAPVDLAEDWFSVAGVGAEGDQYFHPNRNTGSSANMRVFSGEGEECDDAKPEERRTQSSLCQVSKRQLPSPVRGGRMLPPGPLTKLARHPPTNTSRITSLHRPSCPQHLSCISFYPLCLCGLLPGNQ